MDIKESKQINIMYLLYRENIYSPLVKTQVLDVLSLIAKMKGVKIHFAWLMRIDYKFKHREEINAVREYLFENNIELYEMPIIVGCFPLQKNMFDFVYAQANRRVRHLIQEKNIQVAHTRGYNAGLFITRLKQSGVSVAHVFDPRSPYLTEIQSTYGVKQESEIYKYWNENEQEIVSLAETTIGVSKDFCEYLTERGGKVSYIPNNSKMDDVPTVSARAKKQRRKSLCFVGSLGYGWNNVNQYIAFMKEVLSIDNEMKFELYILPSCREIVQKELTSSGISEDSYLIDSLPPEKVGAVISGCMAGLQIMGTKDNRLGIKTVDYLAAGVPVICNSNAVGAANLVEEKKVGFDIDKIELREILDCLSEDLSISERCASVAYDNFSTDVVAEKYYGVYFGCMNEV